MKDTLKTIDTLLTRHGHSGQAQVARDLMRLFGAHHAMRCDQGGSSAMYLDTISKIVSRPSDGKERPTYTHFGVGFGQ